MTRPISEYLEALDCISMDGHGDPSCPMVLSAALDELASAREHVLVLRKALKKYGRHLGRADGVCDVISEGLNMPCSCGLKAAIAATEPKETP